VCGEKQWEEAVLSLCTQNLKTSAFAVVSGCLSSPDNTVSGHLAAFQPRHATNVAFCNLPSASALLRSVFKLQSHREPLAWIRDSDKPRGTSRLLGKAPAYSTTSASHNSFFSAFPGPPPYLHFTPITLMPLPMGWYCLYHVMVLILAPMTSFLFWC
jgi:hypothetical protein